MDEVQTLNGHKSNTPLLEPLKTVLHVIRPVIIWWLLWCLVLIVVSFKSWHVFWLQLKGDHEKMASSLKV
jgi:hypothetical protein